MIAACIAIQSSAGTNPGLAPIAIFHPTDFNPYVGDTIQFIDNSTNNPISWTWDIDGSVFSQIQNPTFYCSQFGTHDFRLTVSNQYGSSQYTLPITIQIN
jgi:PKD repeat protein